MIVEAEAAAKCLSIKNVRWIIGGLEDLGSQMGKFRLVTMGSFFHWTDRGATLRSLAETVVDGGRIVLVNDSGSKIEDWQKAIKTVIRRCLGEERRA